MTEESTLVVRSAQRFAAERTKENLDRFRFVFEFSTARPQLAPVTTGARETPRRGSESDYAEMLRSPAPSLGLTVRGLRAIGSGAEMRIVRWMEMQ
jgi:hypothetical protein